MYRRVFLAIAASAIAGACLTIASPDASAAPNTMNVSVRVYQLRAPGIYHFLPGVKVQLDDGRVQTTGSGSSMPGIAYFYKVPRRNYTAKALVNGVWRNATSKTVYGPNLRIDVQVP